MRTKVREYRMRHNMTQQALADQVGVRRETIIFLEQGRYNPSLRLAYNIAQALGSGIDEIFSFKDEKTDD